MKRYISMFLITILCFILQTTVLPGIELTHVMPNLLVIVTAIAGFMHGRKFGMVLGILSGILVDLMYSPVVGINIAIYVIIGYVNGMANKLYFKEDLSIPLIAIAISDLMYGFLYYICNFMMRGRLDLVSYFGNVMISEMIYTTLFGVVLYKFVQWLDEKLYPEKDVPFVGRDRFY